MKKKKKPARWIRPKFILRLHWIKGLDMQKNPTLGFVQNKSSRVMCLLVHMQPQRPRGQEDGLAGDHGGTGQREEPVEGESEARRGEARWKSQKANPETSLNPVEFLSSSAGSSGRRQEPVERAR